MTTQEHLTQFNVTMEQAQNFIMDNLSDLGTVYSACNQFSVNNDMIAEIIQDNFPGLTGEGVSSFWDSVGFDGDALGFNSNSNSTGGTLDISGVLAHEEVTLHENISEHYGQQLLTLNSGLMDEYILTESTNIGSPEEYGYTFDGAYGGVSSYSHNNGNELTIVGVNSGNSGNYDLIYVDAN
ncbi:hypothetical protein [Neptunomonas sp.]|uniref:hypothetical protein n=1 Tax=Neptunomonas sp. TaxID=1971898 RepID=UPI0025DB3A17|nr:hypothetical protein [Neptunomonas sp.]